MRLIAGLIVVVLAAGCSSEAPDGAGEADRPPPSSSIPEAATATTDPATTTTAEPVTTTTPSLDPRCEETDFTAQFGEPETRYAVLTVETSPNGSSWWLIASPDGGLWATNHEPGGDGGALTIPLNDEARSESDVGVDVSADAISDSLDLDEDVLADQADTVLTCNASR